MVFALFLLFLVFPASHAYISISSGQDSSIILESGDYFQAAVAYYESKPTLLVPASADAACTFALPPRRTQLSQSRLVRRQTVTSTVALLAWSQAQANGCTHYKQAVDA